MPPHNASTTGVNIDLTTLKRGAPGFLDPEINVMGRMRLLARALLSVAFTRAFTTGVAVEVYYLTVHSDQSLHCILGQHQELD